MRLRKNEQIRGVLDNGVLLRGKYLLARWISSEKVRPPLAGSGPFLAVVISRKKSKKAVVRNRMKRQLREIFRKKQKEIFAQTACVLVAKQADKKISYQELEKDFSDLMARYKEKSESKSTD